ncbi:TRAP transporter substrate-binding protein [Oceanobacillus sp. CFH 90083]|uniref:TRAP transporter substrate-binding protein n=1 Tax=Oceanobacillus sp. CFH 90083 TaxID=2592336 RepID=UPI00128DBDD9|nr:TRAP transporter substrate-binding protein [Oceanobacillus sp. CFH 90083]
MKKVLVSLFLILSVILAACGSGNGAEGGEGSSGSGDQIVMRAGTGANQEHSTYLGLEKFKEIVEEKSDGSIEVEVYHSGQLGDDREMAEAVQLGSQEVVVASDANLSPFVSEVNVLGFPFLFPTREVAHEVLDGEAGQAILDKFDEKNMVGLAYWENGFRNITNSRQPIESVEDLSGLKLRTMSSDLHIDVFAELGANPTPMAFTELYTGLQQGTVDGQENPNPLIYQQKFHDVQDYLSETRHVYTPYLFLVSKGFYDELSDEHKQIIEEAALEAGEYQREENHKQDQEALESLVEEGIEVNEVSEEVRNEMQTIIEPLLEDYSQEIGEDIVNQIYEAVEEAS